MTYLSKKFKCKSNDLNTSHLHAQFKPVAIMLIVLSLILTALLNSYVHASITEPEKAYEWIEYLYKRGETALTIHEGLRFIYYYPMHPFSDKVHMLIGKSYLEENRYEKALSTFEGLAEGASRQDIREEAELWIGNILLKQGNYSATRRRCDEFLNRYPHSPLRDRFHFQKGWSLLKEWRWEVAEDAFLKIDPNSIFFPSSQEVIKETREWGHLKKKSPRTAGVLSLFLPGSGYIYAGKWQTGIAALIVNGAFIGASIEAFDHDLPILGGIIGIVELGWYAGTIYGSINSVKRYNYAIKEDKLKSLGQRLIIPVLQMEF